MATPGTAPATPTATEGGVPEWFARRRSNREVQSAAKAICSAEHRAPATDGVWYQRAWRSFLGVIIAGYGLSAILHLVALAVFSLIVMHAHDGGHSLDTVLGVEDGMENELLDPQSFEISAGSEGAEEIMPDVEPVPIDLPNPLAPVVDSAPAELPGIADGAGEDTKNQEGSGADSRFVMPQGSGVVREGSFAAWTIPADPRVGQDYAIIVEVTLPEGTENYRRSDLSGRLVGTDGYQILIPDGREFNGIGWQRPSRTPMFRLEEELARIVFFVRGSNQRLVRDTIQIRSRLLDETQELEIIF